MKKKTPFKHVATEVFGDLSQKVQKAHGIATLETRLVLKPLRVKYDHPNMGLRVGDVVYVSNDALTKHAWPRTVYNTGGDDGDFILVPEEFILLVLNQG